MATPQTNIAEGRSVDLRDLVARLADELSHRTFSPRIKLLDIRQVAEATTLSQRTIERMVADGEFPKPQAGIGKRMWRESTLVAWMDRNDPNLAKGE
jgi:excisionase family DNA binding protein